jgi:predicted nicotinamide N-methyase
MSYGNRCNVETGYAGPERIVSLGFGTLPPIRLIQPADPDRLLDDAQVLDWNRADDYMPYWAYLWPGAFLLAEALAREPGWPPETHALEIGSGLGLAGLVALARGLSVSFTDYDTAPLEFAARNAALNGHAADRFTTRRLDWREPPAEQYPLILGADVLYERRLLPLVANLLARMLAPAGVALVAGPYRVATEGLLDELQRHGLAATTETLTSRDELGRPVEGLLHRIVRTVDSRAC